jgi:hypothetical protein
MRAILFLLLVVSFSNNPDFVIGKKSVWGNRTVSNLRQYDTSAAKLKKFRAFSKRFFNSIKSNDTFFLKAHVVFPIVNSSLCDLDSLLEKNKKIDKRFFLKNLQKLFPGDLISRIDNEGEFSVSDSNSKQKEFIIVLYDHGEIEVNFTWRFIEKQDKFYFVRFRIEAG